MRTIDVCIPVYKPGKELKILLQRLLRQDYPIRKILIANTEEQYWEDSLLSEIPCAEVFHISKQEFDHGGTRHALAEKAEADLLLFMTQDAVPADRHLLSSLAEAFETPGVKAAYARQLPRKDCREMERFSRSFNYPEESRVKTLADLPELGIKTYFCSDVCAAYDRETYFAMGGFTRHTIFNEDMIFAAGLIKAGYGVAYAAEARVIHSHNYSAGQQFHRNFDLAVSQADHPEIFADVPSEGEGMRLVKASVRHAFRIGKPWLIFPLGTQCVGKYAGYLLGKRYRKLPGWLIRKCTMSREYWKK